MKIKIDSLEYQCWHEVGHATTCLHLGGNVEFIEFIEDETHRGLARARCETTPDIRPAVLCGGFATEFTLSRSNYLQRMNEQEFIQIIFKNASIDREMYFGKTEQDTLTKEEDTEFMKVAINGVVPIIKKHFKKMKLVVKELESSKRIDGTTIKKILQIT